MTTGDYIALGALMVSAVTAYMGYREAKKKANLGRVESMEDKMARLELKITELEIEVSDCTASKKVLIDLAKDREQEALLLAKRIRELEMGGRAE